MNPAKALESKIRELGEKYGLAVDPKAKIWQLSPGEQQRVEILKALIQGAKLLILDEPTSVLTPQEAEALFAVLEQMKREGEAVIFISHKLDEVMAVADTITVLRKGAVVGNMPKADANPSKLAQLMVGKDVVLERQKNRKKAGEMLLSLKNVWAKKHSRRGCTKRCQF